MARPPARARGPERRQRAAAVVAPQAAARAMAARLELEGPEVLILDGSALPFAQAIREAGIVAQEAAARVLALPRPV